MKNEITQSNLTDLLFHDIPICIIYYYFNGILFLFFSDWTSLQVEILNKKKKIF